VEKIFLINIVEDDDTSSSETVVDFPSCPRMSNAFELAQEVIKTIPKGVEKWNVFQDEEKLAFYGLFKQATIGNNTTPQPSFWNLVVGKAKWNAWTSKADIPSDKAKKEYVDLVKRQLQILESVSESERQEFLDNCDNKDQTTQATLFFSNLPSTIEKLKDTDLYVVQDIPNSQLEDLKSISSEDFVSELSDIRSRIDALERKILTQEKSIYWLSIISGISLASYLSKIFFKIRK
jgi:acyl-CoA-binding protein